jgi:hypothetical protein
MRHIGDLAGLLLAQRKRGPGNLPPVTAPDAASVFSGTPTIIDVLANDSDPEGGQLTIVSATAEQGTVAIRPDRTLLYTSAPGFTGADVVTYVAGDPQGGQTPGTLTVTVAGPLLAMSPNADGTVTVAAATGAITLTVTSPAEFAGTYVTDTALLSGGPVPIVAPRITGQEQVGAQLTAQTGLWIFEGTVSGEAWSWRRNGTAIAGATALNYTVAAGGRGQRP